MVYGGNVPKADQYGYIYVKCDWKKSPSNTPNSQYRIKWYK